MRIGETDKIHPWRFQFYQKVGCCTLTRLVSRKGKWWGIFSHNRTRKYLSRENLVKEHVMKMERISIKL